MKLSDKQVNFIRLLLRSEDKGEGWRFVSDGLWPFVTETVAEHPELYERKKVDEVGMIRLTERGLIVSEYI